MAFADAQLLQMINEVAVDLSSSERRRLSYLCGSIETDASVAGVKEMLKSQLIQGQVNHLFLVELVFWLKRFDILRKVFSTSKDEAERTLRHRHVLSKYRVLMADVSEDMAGEDLKSVKFLLSGTLARERMDDVTNFLDVVVELEKLDRVSPESVEFIEQCLINIGRVDLAKKVNVYQRSVGAPEQQQQSVITHQASQQQRFTAPLSYTTPHMSPLLHHPRQEQSQHSASENSAVAERSWQCRQSPLDEYRLGPGPRGVCVIIDCVGNDGDMLEHRFRDLQFSVLAHKWLSVDDSLSALRGVFRRRENQEAAAFVCCIISRGTPTDLLATDSRGTGLRLDTVRRLFTAEACPMLAGKPKLFIIQRYSVAEPPACTGPAHRDEDLEWDGAAGPRVEFVPTDADVFWSHCWTDEQQLERSDHRSVYLRALSEGLERGQRRRTHLVEVHTQINGVIYDHNRRNPDARYHVELRHTLRKNLFLT